VTSAPTRNLLRVHTILVYAFLYAPILVLVAFSFNVARRGARWTGFTANWYEKLFANESMRDAAINSLLVAAAATVVSTVVGTAAALGLRRLRPGKGAATRGLIYLPIVIPEIVLGVSLVSLFGLVGMNLSLSTVILAHVAFSVSYVAIVVRARLAGIDSSLEEAAKDLGAGPVATFLRVTLPLIAPGVVAAGLLVFTLSLDDYVVTSLVAGPGATTLPLNSNSMLKVEVTPEVNAACTVLLGLTVVLVAVSQWLLGSGNTSGREGEAE
jgi:spermidine/putrescine transport system permease protein